MKQFFQKSTLLFAIAGLILASNNSMAQENKGKPIAKDWEKTYYYSYFGDYYYGYYNGLGATDLGVDIGLKGASFDITTWFHDHYGAGMGFAFGYKNEFGLTFIFAYAVTPKWQINPAPVIRFIPESAEKAKHVKIGFDVDIIYYYWKDIGFKVGYSSTTELSIGANFRLSNIIFER